MSICDLNIYLNPCSRAQHAQNAGVLQSVRDVLCTLTDLNPTHFFSEINAGTPIPYDAPINPPVAPAVNNVILYEKFIDTVNIWTYDLGTDTWTLEFTWDLAGVAVSNSTSCVTNIDLFAGPTFTDKLNQAIAYLDPGGKLDLTNQGDNVITSTIIFDKPINVFWPIAEFNYTGAAGTDMFEIATDQFNCYGQGRTPKASVTIATTKFIMASGRYHFYSRGHGLIRLEDFDCFGIKSLDTEDYPNANLSGSGGLYFEKADPGTTSGGNNITGLFLVNIYIESTYAHGVYMDTPIISKLTNVRTSNVRGHSFYMNGGTSTVFESCFAASGYQAGFCISGAAYCTLYGCAGETHGVGFWLRSVQGISIFSTGGESNKNVGAAVNPVLLETLAGDDITPVSINDISSDFISSFRGITWLISGGQGIGLFSPYSTNINQEYGFGNSNTSRHFKVMGNTRGLTITNPRIAINSGATVFNRFDWEFDDLGGDIPSDVSIYYDPSDGTITPVIDSYFTNVNSALNSTYIKADGDDIVFYAGKQIYLSNDFDATVSLEIGSGAGTVAPKKVLLAP